jgi:hypothetical protein
VTATTVCRPGYARSVRHVSSRTKNDVYAAYGMTRHFDGHDGELDHLVSLELGGSNSRANLFPEAAAPAPGAHQKDRLENRLHDEVCSGQITLRAAERTIAGDWVAACLHNAEPLWPVCRMPQAQEGLRLARRQLGNAHCLDEAR